MAKYDLADSATAALRGLLRLLPDNESAAENKSASLSLVVHFRHVAPSAMLQGLQSLATMESYSHSLQGYPLVKQAFWEQVLASDLMAKNFKTFKQQLNFQDEQFPRIVLDLSRCPLTAELLETLTEFFSQSRETQPMMQSFLEHDKENRQTISFCRLVPVALKLVRCRLAAELITKLKTVLMSCWRTRNSTVRFYITSLDLSENSMRSKELIALAELLDDCRQPGLEQCELSLRELVLENALSREITTANVVAFQAFVGAAFSLNRSYKTSLKRLSLAGNSLSHHYVGCICSALRCESIALEELSLAHTFSLVDPADRETCWQWVAIGLRPLISRGRQPGLRRLDLSGNPLFPMDSQVWRNTLRDPQTTVLRWLENAVPRASSDQDARFYCLLSSRTELYLSPSETSTRLLSIEKEVQFGAEAKEWEVVASFPNEKHTWLCILIPGFGVAWTSAKHAMLWECNDENLRLASAVLPELVLNDMVNSRTTTEALTSFIGGFGGQLRSLELRRNSLSAMDLDAILAGCQQLHNLDIEGCRVVQLQLLVDALSGVLGQNLRKLNLNANLVGANSVNMLTAVLRGQVHDRLPVLEELRLAHNMIGANGVRYLHAALETNQNLMLLELDLPNENVEASRRPDDEEYIQLYRTRCMRLDMTFQNELLGMTPLPLERKLAFLLVLNALDVVLDRGMCSTIFCFAADEKRRRIVWNITHDS